MKLGVNITAFREPYIVPLIKQYEGIADRTIVTVSKRSWYGDMEGDDTAERAVRDTEATVIQKHWRNEAEQRNEGMDYLRDMDYVIISHADTWFLEGGLKELKKMNLTERNYTTQVYTYWKDYDTVIYPHISLPTLIVKSDTVFNNMINFEGMSMNPEQLPIDCFHTSWVGEELVKKKIQTYSHATEISGDWYNDVFMKGKTEDFAPTTPPNYKGVIKHPLPDEIRRYFEAP